MNIRILSAAAALAALLSSCVPENKPSAGDKLSAELVSADLTSVEIRVDAAPQVSYFAKLYSAESFSSVSVEAIVRQIEKKVAAGDSWVKYMNFGTKTFVFDNLQYGRDYKLIVFGLRGDGTVTSDPVVLDVRTDAFTAELEVSKLGHFGFDITVKPNNDKFYWTAAVLPYDPSYNNRVEIRNALLGKLYNTEFDKVAFNGIETISSVCTPGEKVAFAVCAISTDCEIISDVFSVELTIPYDGFPVLAEDRSLYIHLCLYNSEKVALGTMIEMTNPAEDTFVFPMVDINDSAETLYGIAVRTASETEVCDFFAAYAQAYYDEVVNDPANQAYFGPLTPYQSFSLLYNTSASFPRTWDPVTAEQLESHLGGQSLRNAVYAACLLQIDSNGKVSVVEDSFARASYEF